MKSLKSQSVCALLKGWVVQSATTLLQRSDQALVLEHTGCNVCYNTRIKLLEHTSVVHQLRSLGGSHNATKFEQTTEKLSCVLVGSN